MALVCCSSSLDLNLKDFCALTTIINCTQRWDIVETVLDFDLPKDQTKIMLARNSDLLDTIRETDDELRKKDNEFREKDHAIHSMELDLNKIRIVLAFIAHRNGRILLGTVASFFF